VGSEGHNGMRERRKNFLTVWLPLRRHDLHHHSLLRGSSLTLVEASGKPKATKQTPHQNRTNGGVVSLFRILSPTEENLSDSHIAIFSFCLIQPPHSPLLLACPTRPLFQLSKYCTGAFMPSPVPLFSFRAHTAASCYCFKPHVFAFSQSHTLASPPPI